MAANTRSRKKDTTPTASNEQQQENEADPGALPDQEEPPGVDAPTPESHPSDTSGTSVTNPQGRDAQIPEGGSPAESSEDQHSRHEDLPYTDTAEDSSDDADGPDHEDEETAEEVDVTFTDTTEEPENSDDSEDGGTAPQESEEPEKEEPPTAETLNFHIHRNLVTGRATLAVSGSGTDPFYKTVDHLTALEEALAMIPDLHQEARAHWEQTPRYPESQAHKPTPAPVRRPQPQPSRTGTSQPAPAQTQQASLF